MDVAVVNLGVCAPRAGRGASWVVPSGCSVLVPSGYVPVQLAAHASHEG